VSASVVTISGFLVNNFGLPMVGVDVSEQPVNINLQGNTIIGNIPPTTVQTDATGMFSMTVVGGVLAKIVIPAINAVIQAFLPSSGGVTLQQLLQQSPNVVQSSFPPLGNLNIGGYTFLNVGPASQQGNPVVVGSGLGEGLVFASSGTYNPPVNATLLHVHIIGAGGGGGGGYTGATHGGGGGGGGQVMDGTFLASGGPLAITIGAGGTPGPAATAGGNGGDTSVTQNSGANSLDAQGGLGGGAGASGSAGTGGAGGSTGAVVGAAIENYTNDGVAGANGTSGAGGAGAGLGLFGGSGGTPSSGLGFAGMSGLVVITANTD